MAHWCGNPGRDVGWPRHNRASWCISTLSHENGPERDGTAADQCRYALLNLAQVGRRRPGWPRPPGATCRSRSARGSAVRIPEAYGAQVSMTTTSIAARKVGVCSASQSRTHALTVPVPAPASFPVPWCRRRRKTSAKVPCDASPRRPGPTAPTSRGSHRQHPGRLRVATGPRLRPVPGVPSATTPDERERPHRPRGSRRRSPGQRGPQSSGEPRPCRDRLGLLGERACPHRGSG